MNISEQIKKKIQAEFQAVHMELHNESHLHAGPATDSHFNLLLVSESFSVLNKVKRHQAVYRVLADELAGSVHALALHLYTPSEWKEGIIKISPSPNCEGKN